MQAQTSRCPLVYLRFPNDATEFSGFSRLLAGSSDSALDFQSGCTDSTGFAGEFRRQSQNPLATGFASAPRGRLANKVQLGSFSNGKSAVNYYRSRSRSCNVCSKILGG